MKTILLCMLLMAQVTPERPDNSPNRTKHERTRFYFKDGKTECGRVVQYDSALWHAYVQDGITVPSFETRELAVKWVKAYCPIEGKPELKK